MTPIQNPVCYRDNCRKWTQSTINGNRARGTGILNNELFIGRLVWNRLDYEKDPDTKKRRSREHAPKDVKRVDVPHLRIVDDALRQAVKDRQEGLQRSGVLTAEKCAFWAQRRPAHLLAKLCTCDRCGGGFAMISATHLGCSTARNQGRAACTNRRTIARATVEARVLDAISTRLMAPDIFRGFVAAFTDEWNKERRSRNGGREAKQSEFRTTSSAIQNLVRAIEGRAPFEPPSKRLKDLESRKKILEAELSTMDRPAPRLMPNLAELYRTKIADLRDALDVEDLDAANDEGAS